jgi:anaerobic selenocysteine-containing dehydrogenase
MISPKNDDSMNSTFGNRPAVDRQTAVLHMTAADAARRGIADTDQVRVWNDRGSLLLVARVDDSVRSGVVCAPAVRWGKTRARWPQCQRAHLGAAHRCRRRRHVL